MRAKIVRVDPQIIQQSIEELELDANLSQFVQRHWQKAASIFKTLIGLLLQPATPTDNWREFAEAMGWGKNRAGSTLNPVVSSA